MDTALIKDVDEQPQSSWYRKPDGPHRLSDIRAQPQADSVLTDDDDHVRDVDEENPPTPHSAWYRKPRPERVSSIGPDLGIGEQADEKTRRICGCSRPTFIVIMFFLVVVVAAAIAWRCWVAGLETGTQESLERSLAMAIMVLTDGDLCV
ncbi:hypothetical protein INS49_003833 [Diaporthe citri]|uniref:uncharacterized protein n=1 Tax=Diaporthe citri TaxID=83186 RepID=UPI001C813912|nr:uncharacterized protein INS49_003833 [Diaporthe citri]KAG6354752.1 hypothetical protein INS49_003833 [Diaporthe citri]